MALKFSNTNSMLSRKSVSSRSKKLKPEINNISDIFKNRIEGYYDDRSCINLPFDKEYIKRIKTAAKRYSGAQYFVVIGIGGSNLGTVAVAEAVFGKPIAAEADKAKKTRRPKLLFADTVDPDSIKRIIRAIEPALKRKRRVVLNLVSKSGSTTESVANFEILLSVLKRYSKSYHKDVIVTTDLYSKLWNIAEHMGFGIIEIPKKVGGRYSVLSAAGLLPLAAAGADIDELVRGAASITRRCLSSNIKDNAAALSAVSSYINYRKGNSVNDHFFFSNDLESLGKWCRQLMAESLGKEKNLNGKRINAGILPTVSIGSTDLHSIGQLYLAGPYDKYVTFITLKKFDSSVKVPNNEIFSHLVKNIQKKELSKIMEAIVSGVKAAFARNKRPFSEIILQDKSEISIGEFMQFKIFETIYLGCLMDVNPFGQPKVEDYKEETRKLLEKRR